LSRKVHLINKIIYIALIAWTLLLLSAGVAIIYNNYSYANSLAKNEAVVSVKKDLAYRSWVASHGGVYVPITKKTPPNPYLSHIKNRDVYTSAGQHLTLMNPAYTLSQMMHDYTKLYGTKGHITSRILMNPKNKPDKWEEKVLKKAEVTRKAYMTKENINGKEYFRYLRPIIAKKACLKCHAFQGYRVGDVRGGVSVSIPLEKYYAQAFKNSFIGIVFLLIIYGIGLYAIFYGKRKAQEIVASKIKDYEQHIYSLVNMIEKRDSYTAGHTQRVAKYSVAIAKELGIGKEQQEELRRACMLHDIGKISTPDSILLKPGKLTPLEFEIIKEHVVVSYELLKDVDIYGDIAEIIRNHHEHYDGSGYPRGLIGKQIPMLSQIMSVADTFDAMTTNRVYKPKKNVSIAIKELQELSAKQVNPDIVKVASIVFKDINTDDIAPQIPKTELEQERFAYFYRDQITGTHNKDYLDYVIAYNNTEQFMFDCLYTIKLHNFTQYNKRNNWSEGDKILKKVSKKLEHMYKNTLSFRIQGDDFILLSKIKIDIDYTLKEINEVLQETKITVSCTYFNIKELDIKSSEDIEKLL